jgi:hypothetical protein
MKKYAALLLMMASVVCLGWAGYLTYRLSTSVHSFPSSPDVAPLYLPEGVSAMQRLEHMEKTLSFIDSIKVATLQTPVAPLAPTPAMATSVSASAPAGSSGTRPTTVPRVAPAITIVYLSSDMQRVVIDGLVYALGDSLPNGGKLVTLNLDNVVVDYKGRRKVYPIPKGQVLGSVTKPIADKAGK